MHHKMAFFLVGGRGRAGEDGILNCIMIETCKTVTPPNIYIHFDNLEKQSSHL